MAKKKIVIAGGGWGGCGAAIAVVKAGAEAILLERTDMLLGTGLAGGMIRNNGRFPAAEEIIAMGNGDLINRMDETATHGNHGTADMPHHKHGTVYKADIIEPLVRKTVLSYGVKVLFEHRMNDVVMDGKRIKSLKCANGEVIEGDAFVDTTGTAGSQPLCTKNGNGCCMCVLRCPTFGHRVSIAEKAGLKERSVKRPDGSGKRGAFSGACEIPYDCVSEELQKKLWAKSALTIPLPEELRNREKLRIKACMQYSAPEYAENLVIMDNGYFKIVAPYMPIDIIRQVPGFELARYVDPLAGGKGNSIRYNAMVDCENTMQAKGLTNLFCGGEKAGAYVGHIEAVCTGSLAARNAVRHALGKDPEQLPTDTVLGGLIDYANSHMAAEGQDLVERYTFSGIGYFEVLKQNGLYTTDVQKVKDRVAKQGLTDYFDRAVA